MRINELYTTRFLKSGDLVDSPKQVVIDKVMRERLGDDIVPILNFESGKPMTLNRTNAHAIAEIAGTDETKDWHGVVVVLFRSTTEFKGQTVGCIRVKGPLPEEEINF